MSNKFIVGQEVFCILNGEGKVRSIVGETVCVDFNGEYIHYCDEGFLLELESEMPLLYPCRPQFLAIQQDTKVWVWNEGERASERKIGAYFSHFSKEGKPVVFGGGQTSWTHDSTTEYDYFEVVR